MRIQWKLFMLLLAVGVLPLALVATVSLTGTARFGHGAVEEMSRELSSMVASQVARDANSASAAVAKGAGAARAALRALSTRAEVLLSRPYKGFERVYYSEDYDTPGRAPAGMQAPPGYAHPEGGASREVNFDQFVFVTAPGVSRLETRGEAARLSALLPEARALFEDLGGSAFRLLVTLKSGLTAAYPGFGGYPKDFDPRASSWYRRARDAGGPIWSELLVSRSSGQALFSFASPLHAEDGRFAGVASIELPLSWFLQEAELASAWTGSMRSFIVAPEEDENGHPGLTVLAGKNYARDARQRVGGEYESLEPEREAKSFRAMAAEIATGKAGVSRLPFDGQDSVWAWSPLGHGGLAFLLVVPASVASSVPDHLSAQVEDGLSMQWFATYVAAVGVALSAVLAAWIVSSRGVASTRAMLRAWERLGEGDFETRLELETGDERDQLVRAFNDTVPKLAERLRLRRSVDLAKEIQEQLLPVRMPEVPGIEVAGRATYSAGAGGDFYDVFQTAPGGPLFVAVGDVSGHDVAAALLMASTRAYLRSVGRSRRPLAERVAAVNRLVCADMGSMGHFVTLFCLECDPSDGGDGFGLRWVRAGHEPAWLVDPATERVRPLEGAGAALGMVAGKVCEEGRGALSKAGELVALCTDGVFEAENGAGEQYGRERFKRALLEAARKGADAAAVLEEVLASLSAHCGERAPEDDVTVVIVRRIA